jgi:tetratricopeptide (TPR) repeat protein
VIASQREDSKQEIEIQTEMATMYLDAGQLNFAESAYRAIIERTHESGDILGETQAMVNLGILFRRRSDPDKAIEYYKNGLLTYERLGMIYETAQVLNNLAGAYLQLGKTQEALDHYQRALDALHDLKDVDFRAQIEEHIRELREI